MGKRARAAQAVVALLFAIGAACTTGPGGPDVQSAPEPTALPVSTVEREPTTMAETTTTTPTTTTIEDLSALDRDGLVARWARDRASAVERISAAGWGLDGDALVGPGGLRFDVSTCPEGWLDGGPPAAADDPLPLSWWTRYHGPGPQRAQVFLDWLGDDGLVGGRPIEFVHGPYGANDWELAGVDDAQQAAEIERGATDQVAEAASRAVAVVGFASYSGTSAFEWLFDEACLPSIGRRSAQALRQTRGDRVWPSPWVPPALQLTYPTMARAQAELLRSRYSDEPVALLTMDNEFGDTMARPIRDLAAAGQVELVAEVRHDPAAQGLADELSELLASEPAVIVAATAGNPCRLAVDHVSALDDAPIVFLSEFCVNPYAYLIGLDVGSTEVLALRSSVGGLEPGGRETELGRWAGLHRGDLDGFGSTAEWAPMWQAVQILQIAAELPGGPTRSNIAVAAWSFEGGFPLVEGAVTVSWPDDVDAASAARLHRWDGSDEVWRPTDVVVAVE